MATRLWLLRTLGGGADRIRKGTTFMTIPDRSASPTRRGRARLFAGISAATFAVAALVSPAGPASADTVTATIPVSGHDGVAITPDGTHAYVTGNPVTVIDTRTNAVTATVPIAGGSQGVAITPNGARVYVTGMYSNSVSVIDTRTNAVVATVPVGVQPYGVAITPDGRRAYVTNIGTSTDPHAGDANISVIDTATNTVTATIPTGGNPMDVVIAPDGARAYILNGGPNGSVVVIDTATNTITATVPSSSYPQGVAINPAGTHVYIAGGSGVSVIETATNTVTATIPVVALQLAITPDGTRAYVTGWSAGTVSVIDTITNTAIATNPVGFSPVAVATTPDGTRAYITGYSGGGYVLSVSAIDRTPTLTGTPPAGAVGQPYSHAFTVTGQPAPTVTVTAGALPDGLTVSPEGVLSGTPTTGGRFEFTLTASNGIGEAAVLPVVLDITGAATGPLGSLGSLGSATWAS